MSLFFIDRENVRASEHLPPTVIQTTLRENLCEVVNLATDGD